MLTEWLKLKVKSVGLLGIFSPPSKSKLLHVNYLAGNASHYLVSGGFSMAARGFSMAAMVHHSPPERSWHLGLLKVNPAFSGVKNKAHTSTEENQPLPVTFDKGRFL